MEKKMNHPDSRVDRAVDIAVGAVCLAGAAVYAIGMAFGGKCSEEPLMRRSSKQATHAAWCFQSFD